MRRAVVHVNLDPAGALTTEALEQAVAALREAGHEVIAGDLDKLPPLRREIELLHDGDDADELCRLAEGACSAALAASAAAVGPRAVGVAFMSSGTHEDAVAIVGAFGLEHELRDVRLADDDLAVLILAPDALRGVSATKLQTALEAALNREVQLLD